MATYSRGNSNFRNVVSRDSSIDSSIDATGKNLFWKFVARLNKWFNPGHAWTDYQSKNDSMVDSWLRSQSGFSLTNAEREANAVSAEEAQKQRDWEEYMSSTAYQRQVKDMQAAGINPAMAMSSANGASTPSGAAASSVSPSAAGMSFSDIMAMIMMPLQKKLLRSQAQMYSDEGRAALMNAGANVRNAGTNERNAGTAERQAGAAERNANANELRASTEKWLAENNIRISEKEVDKRIEKMSADIAYINETTNYISKNYALAVKDADSRAKSAMAMLKSADAAFQNALTNEYLSNYQADLYSTQVAFNELVSKEKEIDISFLPEKTQAQIYELRERGYYFNQQGKLVDKQGKLVDAQTAETYTRMAVEAVHEACEVVNTATQFIPRAKIGF